MKKKKISPFHNNTPLIPYLKIPHSPHLKQTPFENIVAKEVVAHNGQWFLLLLCFLPCSREVSHFFFLNDPFYICLNLRKSKICLRG